MQVFIRHIIYKVGINLQHSRDAKMLPINESRFMVQISYNNSRNIRGIIIRPV